MAQSVELSTTDLRSHLSRLTQVSSPGHRVILFRQTAAVHSRNRRSATEIVLGSKCLEAAGFVADDGDTGFSAASTMAGIELVNMIRKGQFRPELCPFQQFRQLAA